MLAVRGLHQQGARSRHQQSNKRMSWTVADVQKECICDRTFLDKYGRTEGCPGCLRIGQHTEECRARIEQEMVDKGDAIKIETGEDLKKRKIGEPDINPGGASSSTADTPKRRESEQGSSAKESSLAGCIAAVSNLLCDVPIVDLSQDRTALSGKFPEDELKAGRELEVQNMLNFDAI